MGLFVAIFVVPVFLAVVGVVVARQLRATLATTLAGCLLMFLVSPLVVFGTAFVFGIAPSPAVFFEAPPPLPDNFAVGDAQPAAGEVYWNLIRFTAVQYWLAAYIAHMNLSETARIQTERAMARS